MNFLSGIRQVPLRIAGSEEDLWCGRDTFRKRPLSAPSTFAQNRPDLIQVIYIVTRHAPREVSYSDPAPLCMQTESFPFISG